MSQLIALKVGRLDDSFDYIRYILSRQVVSNPILEGNLRRDIVLSVKTHLRRLGLPASFESFDKKVDNEKIDLLAKEPKRGGDVDRMFWTDGSFRKSTGTFAVVDMQGLVVAEGQSISSTSAQMMELEGLKGALLHILKYYQGDKCKVNSDCKSLIRSLGKNQKQAKWESVRIVENLLKKLPLTSLEWIPRNKNSEAHEAARNARRIGCPTVNPLIPQASIRRRWRESQKNKFTNPEWRTYIETRCGETVRLFFPTVRHLESLSKLVESRKVDFHTIQFLTGHNNKLNRFQTLIGKREDELCRFCGVGVENPKHFVLSCSRTAHIRQQVFDAADPPPELISDLMLSPEGVLKVKEFFFRIAHVLHNHRVVRPGKPRSRQMLET